jgi:hypothetical protein
VKHTISQQIDDLNKVEWEFNLMERLYGDTSIYLELMLVMERESTRHKFRVVFSRSYSRVNQRDFGIKEEPEVPIEISSEAVYILRKSITFKKWPNR